METPKDVITAAITSATPGEGLKKLVASGFMAKNLPCIADMDGCEQPAEFHPEGDVLSHTCKALDHAATISGAGSGADEEVAWAVLMHDCGKPTTQTMGEDGNERFNGHDKEGRDIILRELPRLGLDAGTTKRIAQVTADHMKYLRFRDMRRSKQKALLTNPTSVLGLKVLRCDVHSSGKSTTNLNNVARLKDKYDQEVEAEANAPKPVLTGKDLMKIGLTPGAHLQEDPGCHGRDEEPVRGDPQGQGDRRGWYWFQGFRRGSVDQVPISLVLDAEDVQPNRDLV